MRLFVAASALSLSLIGSAQAFTCSSPEVTDVLKQIDYNNHWKGLQKVLYLYGANVDLKERHQVGRVSTGEDACRATLTYIWSDARGEEHTTEAIAAYTFNPTDDGKDVYVNVVSYDKQYDTTPKALMEILVLQKAPSAEEQQRKSDENRARMDDVMRRAASQQSEEVRRNRAAVAERGRQADCRSYGINCKPGEDRN